MSYIAPVTLYLLDKIKQIDPALATLIANGQKEIRQVDIAHTVQLATTLGQEELLLPSNTKLEGVRDFIGNTLPKDAYTAFDEVSIAYGFSAAANTPAETVEYSTLIQDPFAVDVTNATGAVGVGTASSYTLPKKRIPVSFQNASLQIKNGNLLAYTTGISSHLLNDNKLDHASKQFVKLITPKMLLPETPIEINFRGVKNGVNPAGYHFIRVVLRAVQVVNKAV